MKKTITGRARLGTDEEPARCEHCDREIRNLVFLSSGVMVGERCAATALGYGKSSIDEAPMIFSWDRVSSSGHPIRGATEVPVLVDGIVRTARRTYNRTTNTFSPWALSEAA